jgi:DNA-binding transcriptional MerR regulator
MGDIRYSVRQLARLAGVSVRTLHVYDKMGLLKPSVRTDAGYRHYGEKELLRLQQGRGSDPAVGEGPAGDG